MDDLANLTKAYNQLKQLRADFTPMKERWYSWNYWAQHQQKQFSFDLWMEENDLKHKDIYGCKFFYPDCGAIYDRTQGYLYYEAWRGGQIAIENAELIYNHFLQMCWEEQTLEGDYKYLREQIGEAIGRNKDQLRKYISKKSWYKPRKKVSRETKKGIK